MEDKQIIELYWKRKEEAISETAKKYGRLCCFIAGNILSCKEDLEECVSDTYLAVWNRIPTERPGYFSAFIGRITRNLALKRYEYLTAAKRNPSAVTSLDELEECVSGKESMESELEGKQTEEAIGRFLWRQTEEKRVVFMRRYYYFDSIETIAQRTGFSQSKVKSMLYEMRRKLRMYLESEGIEV